MAAKPETQDKNAAGRFSSAIAAVSVMRGFLAATAASIALVYSHAYVYIRAHPELTKIAAEGYEGADHVKTAWEASKGYKELKLASKLSKNQQLMRLGGTVVSEKLQKVRVKGGGALLSGFVDVLEIVAKKYDVPLEQCSLSVTKVDLDLLGVAAGGLEEALAQNTALLMMNLKDLRDHVHDVKEKCGVYLERPNVPTPPSPPDTPGPFIKPRHLG